LPHDWHPTNARDDREQVNKAREAAESLFKPNKQVERSEAPPTGPMTPSQIEQPAPRPPRIFARPSTMPVTDATVVPSTDPKPGPGRAVSKRRAKIPAAQHDRVRTLVMYGMTPDEVADLYGVPVDVVERIVTDDHSLGMG
jgi:hypothetical protein